MSIDSTSFGPRMSSVPTILPEVPVEKERLQLSFALVSRDLK